MRARNKVIATAVNKAGHDFGNGYSVPKLDINNEVAVYIKSWHPKFFEHEFKCHIKNQQS